MTEQQIMNRERFISIYKENIKRDGSERLLDWLCSSKCNFFTAPFGNVNDLALVEHTLKVYDLLCDYLSNSEVGRALRDRSGREFTSESIAIVALLCGLYKVRTYRKELHDGVEVIVEDAIPYGMAEKSVYMISGFMRLTDDEAFAIRYHLGFSAGSTDDRKTIGSALEKFELAYALNVSYMAASFF